ncbi:MAG: D-galactarate dehydratase [Sutterella sp. 54_7]|nr:MAG: D-galactarate dehydratase [Sutterella sp. 54_7]
MEKRVKVLKLTPHDNVGTALQDLKKGDTFGFKAALGNIPAGTDIVKYAHVIGRASIDIQSGELVHVHNIEGTRGRGDLN